MVEGLKIGRPTSPEIIVQAFLLYLQSIDQFQPEILPTLANAQAFSDAHFIPAWKRKEPILIAAVGDKIVGATFTVLAAPGLEYRIPHAYGHGTWVHQDWRGKGIARALIEEVRRMLRAFDVRRQIGMAHAGNPDSLEVFRKMGFLPHGTVVRFDL